MKWPFSKKSTDRNSTQSSSDELVRLPRDDDVLEEQIRQHKREQIKRDGFDFDAELRRMAAKDDDH